MVRRSLVALLVFAALPAFGPLTAFAQQTPLTIRGRIVADDNNRPLRRAIVSAGRARPALTDDQGRFEIQPGDFSTPLTVNKAGYASNRIERSLPDREVVIRMSRGGVITGRIFDSEGEPAVGMKVRVRIERAGSNQPTMVETEVDDRGEYRFAGLPPGRYSVSPAPTGPRVLTVADNERLMAAMKQGRTMLDFFQQSSSRARLADVLSGDETGNIDFEVPVTETLRALARVRHRIPDLPWFPNDKPGMVTGPPLPELQGGRVMNFGFPGPSRNLDVIVSGGGVVSGNIVDAAGEPFQGVTVRALGVRRENGRLVARAYAWDRVTDDRGRYRLFGLAPGSYLIVASLDATEYVGGGAPTVGFAPLYFPGTVNVEAAQPVRVEAGSDVSGTDLTYAAAPTTRLAGKAIKADGEPLTGRVMLGVSQRSGAITPDPRSVPTAQDGSFEMNDVPPGDYVVQAIGEPDFGPAEFGAEYLTITDGEPPPLTIKTSRGATLEGRFVVDGVPDPPMRAFSLHAAPIDLDRSPPGGRGPQGLAIHDDGGFTLDGLFGPMRLSLPTPLPGWYLKSVTVGGVDVTDAPFDFGANEATVAEAQVVLSNTGATIAGSIEERPGSRVQTAMVIVFSATRDRWFDLSRHVKVVSSGPNGSFDVTGLPPGDYYVAAVDADAALDWPAPDTLESLVQRAVRVTVSEGAVSTVALTLIRR